MEVCNNPASFFSDAPELSSHRIRVGSSYLDVEVRSEEDPIVARFHKFLTESEIEKILEYQKGRDLESMKLFGTKADIQNDARIAHGITLHQKQSGFDSILKRLQPFLKLNLASSEGLLVSICIIKNIPEFF